MRTHPLLPLAAKSGNLLAAGEEAGAEAAPDSDELEPRLLLPSSSAAAEEGVSAPTGDDSTLLNRCDALESPAKEGAKKRGTLDTDQKSGED